MKKIIATVVLASLILAVSVAYSQEVTEWERQVYYKAIDRVSSVPQGSEDADYDRAAIEVAEENGLTFDQLDALRERVWDSGLSEREGIIVDDLYKRLGATPFATMTKEQSDASYNKIYREVANKYGISTNVLQDIDMRAWM